MNKEIQRRMVCESVLDLLKQTTSDNKSLPINDEEAFSIRSLKNILYCAVIDEYDDKLLTHLKKGGNNVIAHKGCLWIPNMYKYAMKNIRKNVKIYDKEDILPHIAPIATLKAIDAKLDEFVEGRTEAEREDFIQRLVSGEGYAGHYNRHRYKMPDDLLGNI